MSHNIIKPGVVTAVQVIMWIQVAANVLVTCLYGSMMDDIAPPMRGAISLVMGVAIFTGIVQAIVVVNIGNRRKWARITAIVLSILNLAGQCMNAQVQHPAIVVIGLGFSIALLVCLFNPETGRWCSE